MTQETRVARIGIYTDKMVLSVMEQDGEGKSFCLYRKETQEDFLGKHGQVDREKLLLEAGKMMELSQKLLCDQTVCVGYGLLRYQPDDFRRELEQSLGIPVQTISGIRQAQAAKSGMMQTSQKDDTVGVFSSDLSTQIFMMDAQEGTEQSFPIGWRSVAQRYSGIIPNRMEEEELRREIRDVFSSIPTLHRGGVSQIRVAGMDGLHRFVLLLSGSIEKNKEGVVLEQEQLGSILRFLRNPSLHWMPVLEQASGIFPQKVFCQLLILESVLKSTQAKKVTLCKICLEGHLYKEERLVVK